MNLLFILIYVRRRPLTCYVAPKAGFSGLPTFIRKQNKKMYKNFSTLNFRSGSCIPP